MIVGVAALAAVLAATSPVKYSSRALRTQLDNLPGSPPVGFKMFTGYMDVSPPESPPNTRKMFYWFVESQNVPSTDPLFLWTNGGPGCSGLGGFLTEQGPFRPTANGTSLTFNQYAWNKVVNMVFIEQPVGVGFSTVTGPIDYGDAQAAADNYRFVRGFFDLYSAFTANDFYISSESYGGHYMPTLAKQLVDRGGVPNFKGVAVGNPLTYMPYRNYGQYGTAYGHQLLPKPLFDQYLAADCKDTWPTPAACGPITDQMDTILSGFDGYALDFPVCTDTKLAAGRHERYTILSQMKKAGHTLGGYFPDSYQACASEYMTQYLNRADVQQAIGVAATNVSWSMCSNIDYNGTDVNQPMMPVWKELVADGSLKIMIYSGDDDSVCATLGSQQFVWDLGLEATSSWQPWLINGQTAGFKTQFAGKFDFVTVHGAGHMVPQTRPAQSLALITSFISGNWEQPQTKAEL